MAKEEKDKGSGYGPEQRDEVRRKTRALTEIVTSRSFIDTLVEAGKDDNKRSQLRANPRAHLTQKGLVLPKEVVATFTEGPPWGVALEQTHDNGRVSVQIRREGDPNRSTDIAELQRKANMVDRVITHDAVLDTVQQAAEDKRTFEEFATDPKAYLQSRGLDPIPDELELKVTQSHCCFWICFYWPPFSACWIQCFE